MPGEVRSVGSIIEPIAGRVTCECGSAHITRLRGARPGEDPRCPADRRRASQRQRRCTGPSALPKLVHPWTEAPTDLIARSPADNPTDEKRECHHAHGEQNPPRDRYARKDDGGSTGGKGLPGQRLIGEPAEGSGSHRRDQSDHDRDGTCNGDQRRTCPEEHRSTSSDRHSSTLTACSAAAGLVNQLPAAQRCRNPARASRPRGVP